MPAHIPSSHQLAAHKRNEDMKKYLPIWLLVLFGLLVAGAELYRTATTPRIGIVDNSVVLTQFSEALEAKKELGAANAEWDRNIGVIKDSLQAIMDTLSAKYANAKEPERKKMQESLNRWNAEYNRYTAAVEKMRPEKQKEILTPVLEKVNAFVKNWAKQNGYQVVLGTGNGGVVLSVAEAFDVTSQVVSDLNKLYSRQSPVGDSSKQVSARN